MFLLSSSVLILIAFCRGPPTPLLHHRYHSLSTDKFSSTERPGSPLTFIDYPDLQHYPTKLNQPVDSEDDGGSRSRSRGSSPIYKPVPYRPYLTDSKPSPYTVVPQRRTETPTGRSPQTRGRSPVRRSRSFRESRSTSPKPGRGLSSDTLNRSYDSITAQHGRTRSASSSPGRLSDGRRGILKHGTASSWSRDTSPSPRYSSRGHSPPTRLSPENSTTIAAGKKRLMFMDGGMARPYLFGTDGDVSSDWKKRHSSMSWFELQL